MAKNTTGSDQSLDSRNPQSKPHSRVLVVEDDICLQTILTRLLQSIDPAVEIKWMTSADEAWTEIQTHSKTTLLPYDLFISDISTPGTRTGIDFWRSCQMRFPETPFLFTSGMPVDEFFKTFGNPIVCPPFLAKPFAVGECSQIMKILLETSKSKAVETT